MLFEAIHDGLVPNLAVEVPVNLFLKSLAVHIEHPL